MTSCLRTLVYHRIPPLSPSRRDLAPDLASATPDLFARHLQHLARFYAPVSAQEVLATIDEGHRLPPRAVLVTFDDGYRDFADIAWPLLKQYRIPCVLFVSTGYAEDPARLFWWDALWQLLSRTRRQNVVLPGRRALPLLSETDRRRVFVIVSQWLKAQPAAARARALDDLENQLGVRPELTDGPAVLSWPELRRLADDGLTIAVHGRYHELLDQADGATLANEVTGARDDVVRQLGTCVPLFAYPNGNFDRRAVRALRDAQFRAAFTTVGGLDAMPPRHPLLLRREQGRASLLRIALKLVEPVAAWRTGRRALGDAPLRRDVPRT